MRHCARMSEQQDEGDVRKIALNPFEYELCADVLDEPPSREQRTIISVDPRMPDGAIENPRCRLQESLVPIFRAQVLPVSPLRECWDLAGMERLKHQPICAVEIDDVFDPGSATASRAGQKDGVPMVTEVEKKTISKLEFSYQALESHEVSQRVRRYHGDPHSQPIAQTLAISRPG